MNIATTKLYLDTRRLRSDGTAALKIGICWRGNVRYVNLGVSLPPAHWDDKTGRVIGRSDRNALNLFIQKRRTAVDEIIFRLFDKPETRQMSVAKLKDMVEYEMLPPEERGVDENLLFRNNYLRFAGTHRVSTHEVYMLTLRHIENFVGMAGMGVLRFEDITRDWLVRFDRYLSKSSPSVNARAIHLRNIRAAFNDAIDNEVTMAYPFRKFQIKKEETRKRSLTVEQLRLLRDFPCEDYQVRYRDMFFLMFYLIGINAVDLFMAPPSALRDGRLEYKRAKTGRLYSIRVEPEAQAIIDRYRGKSYLLSVMEEYGSYKDFLHRMGDALKKIGHLERRGLGGKKFITPLFPELSSYWARHTWATLAADLEIPVETISRAMGHSIGSATTSIYIRFNERKIDEANRKVIDYVNGKSNVD